MPGLIQDVHYAVRALVSRPLHAALTIIVLALAIGANTTVFSIYNGLFLRPLPFPDDDRLVAVYNTYPGLNLEFAGTSIPDYLDRRERAASLEDLAIYTNQSQTLGTDTEPERITTVRASASLFATLGVMPEQGRAFTDEEAQPGNDNVVVISNQLWSTRFGGRADIVGQDIYLQSSAASCRRALAFRRAMSRYGGHLRTPRRMPAICVVAWSTPPRSDGCARVQRSRASMQNSTRSSSKTSSSGAL